jgi:hypothetical protein
MRIKSGINREEIGVKPYNVDFDNLCCSSDTGVSKNSG